jgi:hypothetical protein
MSETAVNLSQIGRMAGVGRAAVVNWRRRHPVGGTETSPTFPRAAAEQWLRDHGKIRQPPPSTGAAGERRDLGMPPRPVGARGLLLAVCQQILSVGLGLWRPNNGRSRRPTQVPASAATPQTQPERLPEAIPAR